MFPRAIKRLFHQTSISDLSYRFMFKPGPADEVEAIVRPDAGMRAEEIKVHRLREADVAQSPFIRKVLPSLLHFVGGRPLVGYYVDFDIAMLDKYILPHFAIELPNRRIEVSKLYYERKYGDAPANTVVDLSFAACLGISASRLSHSTMPSTMR